MLLSSTVFPWAEKAVTRIDDSGPTEDSTSWPVPCGTANAVVPSTGRTPVANATSPPATVRTTAVTGRGDVTRSATGAPLNTALTGSVATDRGGTVTVAAFFGAKVPSGPMTWTETTASTALGFATTRVALSGFGGSPARVTDVLGSAWPGSHSCTALPTTPGANRSAAETATRPRVATTLTARSPTAGASFARSRTLLVPAATVIPCSPGAATGPFGP